MASKFCVANAQLHTPPGHAHVHVVTLSKVIRWSWVRSLQLLLLNSHN